MEKVLKYDTNLESYLNFYHIIYKGLPPSKETLVIWFIGKSKKTSISYLHPIVNIVFTSNCLINNWFQNDTLYNLYQFLN